MTSRDSSPHPALSKPCTRASNAEKHPGAIIKPKKRRSPTEMAIIRAAEKLAKDAQEATALAAPVIIASLEDQMAAADEYDEKNAARPVPTNNTRAPRRTRTFASLDCSEYDEKEGSWSVLTINTPGTHLIIHT